MIWVADIPTKIVDTTIWKQEKKAEEGKAQ